MYSQVTRRQLRLERQRKTGSKWLTILISIVSIIVVITIGFWIRGCIITAPSVSKSKLIDGNNQAIILDSNNQPIWQSSSQRKIALKPNQVPKSLTNALTSIEDRSFYHEGGVNYKRILGAVTVDLLHHNRQQGGSTLTQQLVKDSFFPYSVQNKSIKQKVQEILLSRRVNKQFSKRKIMAMYLNKVYLGLGNYGMATAAKYYMHKSVNQLTTSQDALLAGMVQSPTQYNPYAFPKDAKLRRNTVLLTMRENHKISDKTYHTLKNQPISVDIVPLKDHRKSDEINNQKELVADSYLESVAHQYGRKKLAANGQSLVIKTPLNMGAQSKLMNIVNNENVGFPNRKMQSAVTVLNNQTGQVVAQEGGRHQTKLGGLNRATQSLRSTGSTIKPIMDYAPALDNLGWSTTHTIDDDSYDYPGTNTSVNDWDNKHEGPLPLDKALVDSRNIPAIKTLARVGLKRANKVLTLSGLPKQSHYENGIDLATNTEKLASAYSSLANYGVRQDPSYISAIQSNNHKFKPVKQNGARVMSPQTAFMLDKILEQVPQRGEIGSDAYISGLPQAGKTGTTGYSNGNAGRSKSSISNAWYAGYTKQYTVIVWTGFDNPKESMTQNEANISETIYRKIMKYLMSAKHINHSDWKSPGMLEHYTHNGNDEYAFKNADAIQSPSK